jgi:hypothetical protein
MATVRLNFVPPPDLDIIELRIYEASAKIGPFSQIEIVTAIGEYPDYISTYTTVNATAVNHWFAIDWYDNKGGNLGMSDPIQGNAQYLISEIVSRVMVRDPSINENIIYDEAEAVLEAYLPDGTDIHSAMYDDVNAQERSGLTLLVQARCYLFDISEGEEEYTVGLVSQRKKNSRSLDFIKQLLTLASAQLGLSASRVLQMAEVEIVGVVQGAEVDQTRLLIELL